MNLLWLEEDLSQAHLRLHGTYVENLAWQEVVTKYDRKHTLFYLDPPYWQTEGYGVEFGIEQYEQMAELAKSIQGSMVISINDHTDIRRIFDGFRTDGLELSYTVGGGGGSVARELMIWNENCETRRRETGTLRLF